MLHNERVEIFRQAAIRFYKTTTWDNQMDDSRFFFEFWSSAQRMQVIFKLLLLLVEGQFSISRPSASAFSLPKNLSTKMLYVHC
jgi:hypothetical protein